VQLWNASQAAGAWAVKFAGGIGSWVLDRWRALLLAHLFFLTVWIASEVYATTFRAIFYLYENVPKWAEQIPPYKFRYIPIPVPTFPAHKSAPSDRSAAPCWRDRSHDGDCFSSAEPQSKSPPRRQRMPAPAAPPCRRPYVCGTSDI
jgi:hypothetical protein